MEVRKYFLLVLCGLVSLGYAAESKNRLAKITKRKKIIVGMSPEFKPLEFKNKKGEIVGFDVDIAKKLAEALEVELEIKSYKWKELFTALENHKIDIIISGVSRTLKRAKRMNFTDPYFKTSQVVLVRKEHGDLLDYEEFDEKGIRIGFVKRTTGEEAARKHFQNVDFVPFDGEIEAGKALLKDKIDGFVIDKPFTDFFIKKHPDTDILPGNLGVEQYCFVISQGDFDFLLWLNYFISELRTTRFLTSLYNYWFIEQAWK